MHPKGVGTEAEGCIITGPLEPFLRQAAEKMLASGMEEVGA